MGGTWIGITPVAVLTTHDALEGSLQGDRAVHKKLRGVDPKGVARHAGKALDVELGTEGWVEVHLDAADPGGLEDKDVATRGIAELVGHPIDKDLVTRLYIAVDDVFT